MKILGIDPGLRTTGFGVIEAQGRTLRYLGSGTINPPKATLPERLACLCKNLGEVIERYQPDCAVVEIVFVNVNPQSTLLLGQARGAAIASLVSAKLPVAEYTALQIKQAVVGHGKAAKEQMRYMVARLLSLPGLPGPDAADAMGAAICHAHTHSGLFAFPQKLKQGKLSMKRGRLIA